MTGKSINHPVWTNISSKVSEVKREVNIRLQTKSSRVGVTLPENKFTAGKPTEKMPLPEEVILPVSQHIGTPARATVKRGDKVLTGQKIADSDRPVSAPIHATLSGEVASMSVLINPPNGQPMDAIVLKSDGEDKWVALNPAKDAESLPNEEILKRIRESGIVGAGGATFPTQIKLMPPKEKKIDTVLINGCECEPYITSDHRLMLEYGEELLKGISLIKKVLNPQTVIIGIEENKEDAIEHLEKLIEAGHYPYQIVPLKTKYPMGAEKTLVKTVLGKEVPIGGLPMDVGAVVQNVATAKAVYDAVYLGKPFIERIITVTGDVKEPKNLMVRFGTPIKKLVEYCGGATVAGAEIIMGGPMMGIAQFDQNFPVTKGTNCILVKNPRVFAESDCINCGRCVDCCTMGLMPTLYPKLVKKSRYDECRAAYVDNCVECGACTFVCPAGIPIVQYIKVAKRELARRAVKK
jgi:electron transport complex protein RnfC